jgi:micrococcal nuclease
MTPKHVLVALAVAVASAALALPAATDAGRFALRGTVVDVADGDTVTVRLAGGRTERVRLLGIDAPELDPPECYGREAGARARQLALGRRVRLIGDATQDTRDRYRRLLAYVVVAAGAEDVGRRLVAEGYAKAYVYRSPFARVRSYRLAETSARRSRRGLWGNCGPSDPRPGGSCAASYPTVCVPPPPPDLDCADVDHRRFRVRHDVPDPDPHRFDGDADGVGCESG